MPVQKRRRKVKKKNRKKLTLRLFVLVGVILILGFIAYAFLNTAFWNGRDKVSLVINTRSGDVVISTFDPVLPELTNIVIPGNTQVEVSRQLGTWRIKSVWHLGENEGVAGALLSETITRYFKLPVIAWADEPSLGFSTGNFPQVLKSVFSSYKTNLKIGDRIKIGLFNLRVKNTKRDEINLADGYLKQGRLIDGGEGYVLSGSLPQKILVIFSDPLMADAGVRVAIRDGTGTAAVAGYVGGVLEVLGAKVSSVTKERPTESDCTIVGKDKRVVEKISRLFQCSTTMDSTGNFDLEISIGSEFAKRF